MYLDEQLKEIASKCSYTDQNYDIEPEILILFENEYYTRYLLAENNNQYVQKISTDLRINKIIEMLTNIYLFDE